VSGAEGFTRFDQVDLSGNEDAYIQFLVVQEEWAEIVAWRRRGYDALRLRPGARVVDVGCGIGTVAMELAPIVGDRGRSLGVDISEAMIAEARRRAADAASAAGFDIADAVQLPLADGAVDAYRAERVYQHLHNRAAALAEAHRVLVPGGRLVIQDSDHGSVGFEGDRDLTRRVLAGYQTAFREPWIGRGLRGLLLDAGFVDVQVEAEVIATPDFERYGFLVEATADAALSAGAISREERDAWLSDQQDRAAADRWFMAFPLFTASATRPR
jgi:SAM-dependent methyltransferase